MANSNSKHTAGLSYTLHSVRSYSLSIAPMSDRRAGWGGRGPFSPATATRQKTARLTWNNKSNWYSCSVHPQPHSAMWRVRPHPPLAPFTNSTKPSSSRSPLPPPSHLPERTHSCFPNPSLPPPVPPSPFGYNEHIAPSPCEQKKENGFRVRGAAGISTISTKPRAIRPHISSSRNRTFRYDVCITGGLTPRMVCFTHTKTRL